LGRLNLQRSASRCRGGGVPLRAISPVERSPLHIGWGASLRAILINATLTNCFTPMFFNHPSNQKSCRDIWPFIYG